MIQNTQELEERKQALMNEGQQREMRRDQIAKESGALQSEDQQHVLAIAAIKGALSEINFWEEKANKPPEAPTVPTAPETSSIDPPDPIAE